MDLMSDLDDDKWETKGVPPPNLKAAGYGSYDVFRGSECPDFFEYYMSNTAGHPCTVLFYGCRRDPLKSIGNCKLKIASLNGNDVITGVIIEDDCVEIKAHYLSILNPPPPVKDTAEQENVINMGLISDLNTDHWTNKEKPPRCKSKLGYRYYNLIRDHPLHDEKNDELVYYLSEDGCPVTGRLPHSQRDPLKGMGNCFLKLEGEQIVGIINEDEWVEKKVRQV